ncbi:hypothetical protein ACIQXD_29270 [Streptomyces uncialis]|uniref:hypothetical protein n=1 Tax=Streptomyces uncialis TaxID=1048205 RepID=UPI003829EE78
MLCVLMLGLFVGVGAELMFRGIGVHVFRRAGPGPRGRPGLTAGTPEEVAPRQGRDATARSSGSPR